MKNYHPIRYTLGSCVVSKSYNKLINHTSYVRSISHTYLLLVKFLLVNMLEENKEIVLLTYEFTST